MINKIATYYESEEAEKIFTLIENPSEKIQQAMERKTLVMINEIETYFELEKAEKIFNSIENPSNDLKLAMERKIANMINKAKTYSEAKKIFNLIENPSNDLKLVMEKKIVEMINKAKTYFEVKRIFESIKNPNEVIKVAIVNKYPILFHQIKNPNNKIREVYNKAGINPIISNLTINQNADNMLYYFRFIFKNKVYYKVGITSISLEKRYGSEFYKIDKILYCERVDGAIKAEKEILTTYKEHLFPLSYFSSGYSEVFDIDILGLDK